MNHIINGGQTVCKQTGVGTISVKTGVGTLEHYQTCSHCGDQGEEKEEKNQLLSFSLVNLPDKLTTITSRQIMIFIIFNTVVEQLYTLYFNKIRHSHNKN